MDYLEDPGIWGQAYDELGKTGTVEARLMLIARSLRLALGKTRSPGSPARLVCSAWVEPVELPQRIGDRPPPKREVKPVSFVGRVTGSDWYERFLRGCEEGRRGAKEISYRQATDETVIEDARRQHNNIYRIHFTETYEDGRLLFRTVDCLELVIADMFMAMEAA